MDLPQTNSSPFPGHFTILPNSRTYPVLEHIFLDFPGFPGRVEALHTVLFKLWELLYKESVHSGADPGFLKGGGGPD